MTKQPLPFYPHRQNRDGSFDSICLRCFATVANARDISELHTYDKDHRCNETAVAQRGQIKWPISQTPASFARPDETPGFESRGATPPARQLRRW
jgi:hypothetical protein